MYLLPYKRFSKSARDLAGLLGAYLINPDSGQLFPTTVINWGNSHPTIQVYRWINHPSRIEVSNNKLRALQQLKANNVQVPEFTTLKQEAQSWINNGHTVVCRTILSGHSGAGIVLAVSADQLVDAPLYVKYVKKASEYRVHVAFGEVIDVQQKRKISNFPPEQYNSQIRSHANGWVYCREGILFSSNLNQLAIDAVAGLSIDFGAVDIIYNQHQDKYYVLEVNTAPGLEGETLYTYFNTFYSYFNHV